MISRFCGFLGLPMVNCPPVFVLFLMTLDRKISYWDVIVDKIKLTSHNETKVTWQRAAPRASFRQNAGLKNRLIFRVYQLCLHTQVYFYGWGAYLKPLFLNAEEVMPCKRSIDLTTQPNSKLYQRSRLKLLLCDRTTSVLSFHFSNHSRSCPHPLTTST